MPDKKPPGITEKSRKPKENDGNKPSRGLNAPISRGDRTTIRFRKAMHAWDESSGSDTDATESIRDRYALRVADPPPTRRSMFKRLMITMLAVLATYGALTQLMAYRLGADVLSEAFQEQAEAGLAALEDSLAGYFANGAKAEVLQGYLDSRYGPLGQLTIAVYDIDGNLLANTVGVPGKPGELLPEKTRSRVQTGKRHRKAAGLGFISVGPIPGPVQQNGESAGLAGFVLVAAKPSTTGTVQLIGKASWTWALPVFLLSVLTAYLGTRSITQRLRQAEQVVGRVAAGDMQARIPLEEMDELGRVALTFNRTMDLLGRTLKDLEQTDSARRRMVADFAHDFNTPLTNVLAYLESLMIGDEDGSMDARTRRTFLEVAHDEAGRLAHLAKDLETLTKLEAGQLVMESELVDLSLVSVELARRFIPRAEKQGLEILTDIEPGGEVIGDRMRLEQVGMNLLENSLRYTKEGSITIRVRADDESVTLTISDTGIGIPPSDLDKVSERFYRVDGSRNRATGGSGLGLAIVGRIVQRHGGRITVESELHVGTDVSVWLPREGMLSPTVV